VRTIKVTKEKTRRSQFIRLSVYRCSSDMFSSFHRWKYKLCCCSECQSTEIRLFLVHKS